MFGTRTYQPARRGSFPLHGSAILQSRINFNPMQLSIKHIVQFFDAQDIERQQFIQDEIEIAILQQQALLNHEIQSDETDSTFFQFA